jgi:hypothetical protein
MTVYLASTKSGTPLAIFTTEELAKEFLSLQSYNNPLYTGTVMPFPLLDSLVEEKRNRALNKLTTEEKILLGLLQV